MKKCLTKKFEPPARKKALDRIRGYDTHDHRFFAATKNSSSYFFKTDKFRVYLISVKRVDADSFLNILKLLI